MGTAVLRGVSSGLLVTVLTLLGGMLWTALGLGGVNATTMVDIGIFLSCVVGGYRTAKESGVWVLGGVTGAAFVGVGALLMALFLPVKATGVMQVMLEGAVLGLVAGAIGGGGNLRRGLPFSMGHPPGYRRYPTDEDTDWGGTHQDWGHRDWGSGDQGHEDQDGGEHDSGDMTGIHRAGDLELTIESDPGGYQSQGRWTSLVEREGISAGGAGPWWEEEVKLSR